VQWGSILFLKEAKECTACSANHSPSGRKMKLTRLDQKMYSKFAFYANSRELGNAKNRFFIEL
jgi:hypothetical protein